MNTTHTGKNGAIREIDRCSAEAPWRQLWPTKLHLLWDVIRHGPALFGLPAYAVLLYMLERTLAFDNSSAPTSLSQIANGFKTADGLPFRGGVGLAKLTALRSEAVLVKIGVLQREKMRDAAGDWDWTRRAINYKELKALLNAAKRGEGKPIRERVRRLSADQRKRLSLVPTETTVGSHGNDGLVSHGNGGVVSDGNKDRSYSKRDLEQTSQTASSVKKASSVVDSSGARKEDDADLASQKAELHYVGQVKKLFLERQCVQSAFTASDQKLAAQNFREGVPIEMWEHAIMLGACRKYAEFSKQEKGKRTPIRTLQYFITLFEEVANLMKTDPDYLKLRAQTVKKWELQKAWESQQPRANAAGAE